MLVEDAIGKAINDRESNPSLRDKPFTLATIMNEALLLHEVRGLVLVARLPNIEMRAEQTLNDFGYEPDAKYTDGRRLWRKVHEHMPLMKRE